MATKWIWTGSSKPTALKRGVTQQLIAIRLGEIQTFNSVIESIGFPSHSQIFVGAEVSFREIC